ncbi:MAG: YdaS family helix-turn-helix protein [Gammaproteobacteria bacterium]|nr:YdaS family helix-turn-helix protein [Gammaproteobacteria bacterium]
MTPAQIVIDTFGLRPLARTLDVYPSTVARWKTGKGLVPARYHTRLIKLAEGKISTHDLIYGRSDDN